MRKIYLLFIPLLLVLCLVGYNKINTCTPKEKVDVAINDSGFSESELTITRCTTVVFKNLGSQSHWPASDLHPTHLMYPEFDPKQPIAPGGSWVFIFDRVGNWKCHDHLHPLNRCTIHVIR